MLGHSTYNLCVKRNEPAQTITLETCPGIDDPAFRWWTKPLDPSVTQDREFVRLYNRMPENTNCDTPQEIAEGQGQTGPNTCLKVLDVPSGNAATAGWDQPLNNDKEWIRHFLEPVEGGGFRLKQLVPANKYIKVSLVSGTSYAGASLFGGGSESEAAVFH